jgi:hypothetical protein
MAVVISSSIVLGEEQSPFTHARILYKRIAGTVTASSETAGSPAVAANNPLTYTFWRPQSLPATWEIEAPDDVPVNCFGIAAHTMGDNGNTVEAQVWDGDDWVTVGTNTPTDNHPIMFLIPEANNTRFRIRISGGTVPRVGVISLGLTLDMQRPIYGGHSPINLSRTTVTRPNASERGQWLGRSIIRTGSRGQWQWRNLTADWYRANFDPFVESIRTEPFFIAWRPETFPDETAYCWTSDDVQPQNMGTRDLMEVTLTAEGLGVD